MDASLISGIAGLGAAIGGLASAGAVSDLTAKADIRRVRPLEGPEGATPNWSCIERMQRFLKGPTHSFVDRIARTIPPENTGGTREHQ
jgi:hypothetical protein